MSAKKSEPQLSVREKVCFGLGDISHGLAASSIGFWMLIYMTDVAGLGAYSGGLAIMIGRVWDSVTDPLMGWITDHTESRWGKRRPYLLFGAIPYAFAFLALWIVPEFEGHEVSIFAYTAIALVVFNTCLTVVFVPYTTLTAAISQNYDDRTSLTGYRMAFSQTAFLIGAAVPVLLLEWIGTESSLALIEPLYRDQIFGSWAGTPREAYFLMGIFFALLMIASIWTTFFGTRERTTKQKEVSTATPFCYASSIIEELQGNKPFRIAVCILLITNCATTLVAVNLAYYLQYVLLIAEASTLFITLFAFSILSMPIWVKITKRLGKPETYRVAIIFYALVLCSLVLLGPDNTTLVYFIAALAGIFNAAALMIPWAIIPDVIEFDELKTGKRREGLFYGGTSFCYKFATALAVFISGFVLEKVVGYVPNVPQEMIVQNGMRALIGFLPASLLIAGAVLSLRYPLTKDKYEEIVKELESLKDAADPELSL